MVEHRIKRDARYLANAPEATPPESIRAPA